MIFQSTLPARGATGGKLLQVQTEGISIHAPRTGSDHEENLDWAYKSIFQSTLPARGATLFQKLTSQFKWISIHAPRTGSDIAFLLSSRNPREFQSTLPARGATKQLKNIARALHFNPRSPHGERHGDLLCLAGARISIHAPRTGSDALANCQTGSGHISIHAPRTGSDHQRRLACGLTLEISIHAPRTGSDLHELLPLLLMIEFQSTLPARGATQMRPTGTQRGVFQSTLPARGATCR